jgi:hypothetical protein
MFVDDNVCVDIHAKIGQAIRDAVGSAYDLFGHPDLDRRASCLRDDKFPLIASHCIIHLGYETNSRSLRVTWPISKRALLRSILRDVWLTTPRSAKSPSQIAKLLGLVRHGGFVCPLGEFLSIRLTWNLSAEIKACGQKSVVNKRWWKFRRVRIHPEVFSDLTLLDRSLDEPTEGHPSIWSRPIGLLIPRSPTGDVRSDASYGGLGGWSSTYSFMWRLLRHDLVALGFDMKLIASTNQSLERVSDDNGLHINILEFVGIIINVWLLIYFVKANGTPNGGAIIDLLANNTSRLSWLRYAARSHSTPVRHLAFFVRPFFFTPRHPMF